MLLFSLGAFSIVALVGLLMANDVFRQKPTPSLLKFLHVAFVLIGAVFAIAAAFSGDQRIWINIALALVIIALGGVLFVRRSKNQHPQSLVLIHGGVAVVCYLLLVGFTFFDTPAIAAATASYFPAFR
jgi:FtsH-binding integral membrane protein